MEMPLITSIHKILSGICGYPQLTTTVTSVKFQNGRMKDNIASFAVDLFK